MKTSSRIILIAGVLLLIGGLIVYVNGENGSENPDQRIARTLKDAEDAGRRGSVSGVMETISDNFSAGPWNKARLRLVLMRTMGQSSSSDYSLTVSKPLRIQGSPRGRENERLVVTRFAAFSSGSGDSIYKTNEPIMLLMDEETRSKWLIFHEPYWRIVGIVNLPSLPGSLDPGDFGGGMGR